MLTFEEMAAREDEMAELYAWIENDGAPADDGAAHASFGVPAQVALASIGCKEVNWAELGKIVLSWIITLPASGVVAAIILWVFRPTVCASCPWS